MSAVHTAFHFTLAELQVLKLVCRQADCGGAIELPLDKLALHRGVVTCPACGSELQDRDTPAIADLAAAVLHVCQRRHLAVEFALPVGQSWPAGVAAGDECRVTRGGRHRRRPPVPGVAP
jgi:hypothetical protein